MIRRLGQTLLHSPRHFGALNQAAELASGDYFTFLDHDDFLSPLALHYLAEALEDALKPSAVEYHRAQR